MLHKKWLIGFLGRLGILILPHFHPDAISAMVAAARYIRYSECLTMGSRLCGKRQMARRIPSISCYSAPEVVTRYPTTSDLAHLDSKPKGDEKDQNIRCDYGC